MKGNVSDSEWKTCTWLCIWSDLDADRESGKARGHSRRHNLASVSTQYIEQRVQGVGGAEGLEGMQAMNECHATALCRDPRKGRVQLSLEVRNWQLLPSAPVEPHRRTTGAKVVRVAFFCDCL